MGRSAAGAAVAAGTLVILAACNWPAASAPAGVDALPAERIAVRRPAVATESVDAGVHLWGVERDPRSVATVSRVESPGRSALAFRYELGAGRARDQFAALVAPAPDGLSRYDRITFRGYASRPLRLAVTLRRVDTNGPQHWLRSVYLDGTPRTVTVFFDDMRPAPGSGAGPAPLASIGALMFVIDTRNTKPGTSGEITLSEMAYAY
jgi:hypothetical protein